MFEGLFLSKKSRILKILSIISFTMLNINLFLILNTTPSSGYEISIYDTYPFFFWVFILSILLICISIVILSAVFKYNYYWIYSTISLFVCYIIILSLPYLRGYLFFARGNYDLFSHLARINYIFNYGYLDTDLFYPMPHILTIILNYVSSISMIPLIYLIGIIFTLFYISSYYILGISIFKSKTGALFMLASSFPLMFSFLHYGFFPFFFGLSFVPLIISCFEKKFTNNKWEISLLIVILSLNIVFFHPLVVLILILVCIIYSLYYILKEKCHFSKFSNSISNCTLILLVSFLAWYLSFKGILISIDKVINAVLYSGESTVFDNQLNSIESYGLDYSLIIEYFIKIYGAFFPYILVSFLCLAIVFKNISFKEKDMMLKYSLQFLGSISFAILMSINYSVIQEPIRTISFAIVMSTILFGIFISQIFEKSFFFTHKLNVTILIILTIFLSSALGIFNVYESPWKGVPSNQMTHMEGKGIDWFLLNNNNSVPLSIEANSLYKYSKYKNSVSNYSSKYRIGEIEGGVPSHFGYDINNTKSQFLSSKKSYLITYELSRQAYYAYPEVKRLTKPQYSDDDFKKLNQDIIVSKIYLNGGFEVWSLQ